jgi:hypothetical protein
MKYFTLEWWIGTQKMTTFDNRFPLYHDHLSSIRSMAPSDLIQLSEDMSLHDGQIAEFSLEVADATLTAVVNGDDGTGGPRQFRLKYFGVASFRSLADPEKGLGGPRGYGHWGYDEVDITPSGLIEHRILFSSGIELCVQFSTFELT